MEDRLWWSTLCLTSSLVLLTVLPTSAHPRGLMVTTSRVWVAGLEERMCFVSHALTFEVSCNISLMKHARILSNKIIHLQPDGSICEDIPVPKNISGSSAKVMVSAESLSSNSTYNFLKSVDISIKHIASVTFIQTDKPIYKPGDLVRIRILTLLGPDLKVRPEDVSLAYIEDPSRTRVMQWSKVSAINGLSSLEMQLSDEPRLGTWTIKAVIGDKTESQSFAVEEYVLPKYEVIIHHPSYLVRPSNVTWKVCAKYTYGQPVNGEVKSRVCIGSSYLRPYECHHGNTKKKKVPTATLR